MPSIPGQVLLWLQTSCTYCLPSSNSGQAGALLWRSALQFSKVHNGSQPCLPWASLEAVLGAPSSSKPVTPPTTLKVQLFPSQSSSWLPWSKWWQDCQQLQSIFLFPLHTKRFFTPSSPWDTCTTHIFLVFFLSPLLFYRFSAAFPSQNLISSSKMLCFNAWGTNTTSAGNNICLAVTSKDWAQAACPRDGGYCDPEAT